jgi:hypothetical protein
MQRLKPYYNLIGEESKQAASPCSECGSLEQIEQTWVEYGHGWLPDDYVTKTVCACGHEVD